MEYKYSTIVEPSTYETEGLCDGIPLRRHIAADLEEIGTFRAQEDWRKLVGPLGSYKGGLGPNYSFMTVSVPECLPDRLEIISYANEMAFLHDDITDNASREEGDAANDEMLDAFRQGAQTGTIETKSSGKRQMQAKILREMIAIDRERAMIAMKSWATFVELASGRQHHTHYATLEQYIPYRSVDVGHMFWHGLVTFGCGLTIPDEEAELCKELMTPALIAASLTNDLFSYEKEYEDAVKAGKPDVVNAIWVMMGEHGISEEEAKLLCRRRIKEEIKKYVRNVKEVKTRTDISQDLRKYVEVMQYSLSGNVVWSLQCPRYHKNARYNELQLLRAKHGIEKYPTRWQQKDEGYSSPPRKDSVIGEETYKNEHRILRKRLQENGIEENGVKSAKITALSRPRLHGTETDNITINEPKSSVKENHNSKPSVDAVSIEQVVSLALERSLPRLSDEVVLEPYRYLASLPSKGVRDQVIDALNFWLRVPAHLVTTLKRIVKMLHSSSLMLDDLEDRSPLRRGKPSTHSIYGEAQTINSATYQYIQASDMIRHLENPECFSIFVDEMHQLFIGQSYDLYWVSNMVCPSVAEYLRMVDGKTGGLFRMLTRLMVAESPMENIVDLDTLSCLFGRYFQIRDDYQNLVSTDYTAQKGFCEDLDEGKYSLPLIHTLQNNPNQMQLRALLLQRRVAGKCTFEQKQIILAHMKQSKSLEHTLDVLMALHREIECEIGRLEGVFGRENFELRLLLDMLKV